MIYKPKGVCSQSIEINMNGNVIDSVAFTGGCNGNLQGIGKLVEGMKAEEVISRLESINCNGKGTSCPDQLAAAIKGAMEE